jgi:threonyl-tRNA synthetase
MAVLYYTWNDENGKKAFGIRLHMSWHKSLNKCILGQTLGPAISNGFYDDFEDQKITEADFKKIEDSILEISRGKHEFKLRPVV